MSRNCLSLTQWNWLTVIRCISGRTAVPPPTARIESSANTHARLISLCIGPSMPPVRSMRFESIAQMSEALGGIDHAPGPIQENCERSQDQQHPAERNLEDTHDNEGHCNYHQVKRPDELLVPELQRH